MYLRVQSAVQKTAEELKKQQVRDAEERQKYLASRVPQLNIDGLDQCKQTTDTVSQKLA